MIEFINICKSYGSKKVLSNISFKINAGDSIAFIGKSGKGKSTILNIIGFLDKANQGTYKFDGQNVTRLSEKNKIFMYKNKIGFIFQNFALIDDETVFNNLKMCFVKKISKKEERERIDAALDLVGLISKKDNKIYELSGGEQQRIAIARLFLKNCDLILADEPTGSLDEENKEKILELFTLLRKRGKTIIIVTHDAEVAQWCDRVYKL